MSTPTPDAPPVTVLQSLSPPDGTTRYVDQIVGGAPPEVTQRFFSWRTALFGRYDVLHVHWPELLIRHRSPAKAILRRGALYALLLLLRVRKVPIVRTLHNLRPHESGRSSEGRALAALDRGTALFIRLNPTTEPPSPAPVETIPHGHYRDRFRTATGSEPVPGRILYFGLIRPYKGVETLLQVFRSSARADLGLRIVGRPSAGLGAVVEREQAADPRISSRLRFVADEELVREVGEASLVVLPYREMHNSGAIFVALSLDRPVLVPTTPANAALALEVGPGWINTYEGELTREVLEAAADAAREPERPAPRLEGRDWPTIGRLTYRSYLRALSLARGSGIR